MTLDFSNAVRLFDECLDDRISDEDGVLLLRSMEADGDLTKCFYSSLYVDHLMLRRMRAEFGAIEPALERTTSGLSKAPENVDRWIAELDRLVESNASHTTSYRVGSAGAAKKDFFSRFSGFFNRKSKFLSKNRFAPLLILFFLSFGVCAFYTEWTKSASRSTVAHLTGFDDVVWEGSDREISLGDPIKTSRIRIRSGSVSMKTLNGAEIVLEGPAELRIDSSAAWQLSHGYLSADVPPQHRKLRVKTPQMSIDVLGTEFWVKATEDKSEVHLLRGKLSLQGTALKSQILDAGDAFSISAMGETKLFKTLNNQFVKAESLIALAERKFQSRHDLKLQTANREPSLLLYLDFQEFGRTLPNRAMHGLPLLDSVRVEGCTQIPGALPGEKAVAFRRPSDCLRLELSNPLESFTLHARIRIDDEVRNRCPLLMSEESAPGSIQWMIAKNGIPVLNICKDRNSVFENHAAPAVFADENLRRWKSLSFVYDAGRRNADWYLDGLLIDSRKIEEPVFVALHRAVIGNGGGRNGSGFAISEFRLYERALSPEEILSLDTPQ